MADKPEIIILRWELRRNVQKAEEFKTRFSLRNKRTGQILYPSGSTEEIFTAGFIIRNSIDTSSSMRLVESQLPGPYTERFHLKSDLVSIPPLPELGFLPVRIERTTLQESESKADDGLPDVELDQEAMYDSNARSEAQNLNRDLNGVALAENWLPSYDLPSALQRSYDYENKSLNFLRDKLPDLRIPISYSYTDAQGSFRGVQCEMIFALLPDKTIRFDRFELVLPEENSQEEPDQKSRTHIKRGHVDHSAAFRGLTRSMILQDHYFLGMTSLQETCARLKWEYGLSDQKIARRVGKAKSTVQEHIRAAKAHLATTRKAKPKSTD